MAPFSIILVGEFCVTIYMLVVKNRWFYLKSVCFVLFLEFSQILKMLPGLIRHQ